MVKVGGRRKEVWVKRETEQPSERGIEKRKEELGEWGKKLTLIVNVF